MKLSREEEWEDFEQVVAAHIRNYTIPQYGNAPDDEVEIWSPEMCISAIQKYTKRYGSNQRGRLEALRDMLKVAHFACLIFHKMQPTLDEVEVLKRDRI